MYFKCTYKKGSNINDIFKNPLSQVIVTQDLSLIATLIASKVD